MTSRSASVSVAVMLTTMGAVENGLTIGNKAPTVLNRYERISALGLLDAELLDLTIATALFSALAIIEPISAAVAPAPVAGG